MEVLLILDVLANNFTKNQIVFGRWESDSIFVLIDFAEKFVTSRALRRRTTN